MWDGFPTRLRQGMTCPFPLAHAPDQPEQVTPEDQRFFVARQFERTHLRQLNSGMQPRPIRAKEELPRSGAPHRLSEQIEAAHARGVGENIGMAHKWIDQGQLRAPVVRETPEMRDDEGYVRVFGGEQFDGRDFAHHIVEHRQPDARAPLRRSRA